MPLLLLTIAATVGGGSGCVTDNAAYCGDDAVCEQRAATDPSVGAVCHPVGHFCHAGCASDDDCRDADAPGYHPDRPHCDRPRGHCLATPRPDGDGGAADGATDGGAGDGGGKGQGAACLADDECASAHCSGDGVCCDSACDGPCLRCPTGTCKPRPAGSDCDTTSCADGLLTGWRCTADGACTAREASCGGYRCAAGAGACREACDAELGCVDGFECLEGKCHASLANGEPCGENDLACASSHCVDGVCCAAASCASCERCDAPGAPGSCQPRPAGPAPAGDCPGDAVCGADACDGAGGCAYAAAGASCAPPTCSGGAGGPFAVVTQACDGAGGCQTQPPTSCGFARCQAGGCVDGCVDASDCVDGSLCDRAAAHGQPTGRGGCVDPADVVTPAGSESLAEAVARALAGGKQHVGLAPGSYQSNVSVSGAEVKLIGTGGAGAVVLEPASGGVPALRVEGLGALQVQGLTVQGATSGAPGVACGGGAKLTVVESLLTSNAGAGVETSGCEVVLRRNRIRLNQGGGARLQGGAQVVVNNLVTSNGAPGISALGGLLLAPASGQLTCSANTVANNVAAAGVAAGVICQGGAALTLHGAILWSNGAAADDGCAFAQSNVEGGAPPGPDNISAAPGFVAPAAGDYALPAGSPSLDKGSATAPGLGSIDLAGAPRQVGAGVDQGALERQ